MPRASLRPVIVLSVSAALLAVGAAHAAAQTTARAAHPVPAAAAPAAAPNPYDPAYQHPYRHGVLPTIAQLALMKQWAASAGAAAPAVGPETLSYGGGIDGTGVGSGAKNKVYLVFYGSQWGTQGTNSAGDATFSGDRSGAAPVAQEMFKGFGTGGELWSADLTQWCDGPGVATGATACPAGLPASQFVPYQSGGVLAGVWYDGAAASPAASTQAQLAQVAVSAAAHFGNTTAASNRNAYYVVLSPTGTNPDNYQGQFCAWHDYTTSAYGDIAYSNQPYNIDAGSGCGVGFLNSPGTFDGWTMTLGHEWHEQLSDQNPLGGWSNHTGTSDNGEENSDECAWLSAGTPGGAANVTLGSGTFAEQSSWSNDTNACAMSHPIVSHGTTGTDVVTVAAIPSQSWKAGTAVSLQASGSSTAGKPLTWSATGLPAGPSMNASTGLISGVPTTAGNGLASVTDTDSTPASGLTSFAWTVAAPTAESVSVTNPGAQTGTVGTAVSLQIRATDSAGKALTYSATGLPAGLSISPSTGLISGTPTAGSTSSATVTASSGTASGNTSFSWTVSPAATGGIVNGGFETGTLSGWTASGPAETVVGSGAHSGTRAAMLGNYGPTNGDSTISQTFTTSSTATLSFWYNVTCNDTVQYDWATALLRDNTTGTTTRILPKTCPATTGWRHVTAGLTGGHSYTLSLTNHDDNYPGDPTFTLFDDVTLTATASGTASGVGTDIVGCMFGGATLLERRAL